MRRSAQRRQLKVFLSHSHSDKEVVHDLYQRLREAGVCPWLDTEDLIAGQDFEREIKKSVSEADAIIICLSRGSTTARGYVHKEIKYALDVADQQPANSIFLIPVKLEDCEVPERLGSKHWVDYFQPDGFARLMKALNARAAALKIKISPPPTDAAAAPAPPAPSKTSSSRRLGTKTPGRQPRSSSNHRSAKTQAAPPPAAPTRRTAGAKKAAGKAPARTGVAVTTKGEVLERSQASLVADALDACFKQGTGERVLFDAGVDEKIWKRRAWEAHTARALRVLIALNTPATAQQLTDVIRSIATGKWRGMHERYQREELAAFRQTFSKYL